MSEVVLISLAGFGALILGVLMLFFYEKFPKNNNGVATFIWTLS